MRPILIDELIVRREAWCEQFGEGTLEILEDSKGEYVIVHQEGEATEDGVESSRVKVYLPEELQLNGE